MFKLFYYAKRNTVPAVCAGENLGSNNLLSSFISSNTYSVYEIQDRWFCKASIVLDNEDNDIRHL